MPLLMRLKQINRPTALIKTSY